MAPSVKTELPAAGAPDPLRTKITFDAEAHALRASFKYLPSTGGERDWRKDRKGQGDTYAKIPMPPAPHETYCDYLQGKISDRWLNLSWSTPMCPTSRCGRKTPRQPSRPQATQRRPF